MHSYEILNPSWKTIFSVTLNSNWRHSLATDEKKIDSIWWEKNQLHSIEFASTRQHSMRKWRIFSFWFFGVGFLCVCFQFVKTNTKILNFVQKYIWPKTNALYALLHPYFPTLLSCYPSYSSVTVDLFHPNTWTQYFPAPYFPLHTTVGLWCPSPRSAGPQLPLILYQPFCSPSSLQAYKSMIFPSLPTPEQQWEPPGRNAFFWLTPLC